MSLFKNMPGIPSIRPCFNVGGLFDIPTGTYHQGEYGESILNGGLPYIASVAGPGNSFKSAIIDCWNLTVAERIEQFKVSAYDTEGSKNYARVRKFASRLPRMSQIPHGSELLSDEETVFKITSSADILGDEYFDLLMDHIKEKKKSKGPFWTTPFVTARGEHILMKTPEGSMIDSLSEFKVTAIEEGIVDKNNIGDSGNNIMYMRSGIAKKQMIDQLPNACTNGAIFITMTAHVGDEFELGGQMAPKKHKLTHSKKGSKITGTTKAFEFINNVLYEIFDASLLNNKEFRTGVLYPVIDSDRNEDTTDLLEIWLKVTRNKTGPSGASFYLVMSQREGLLPHLSQFHYLKDSDYFGMAVNGNKSHFSMAIVPEVSMQRTTVRGIIDTNAKVRRAIEISSDMLQMRQYWDPLPNDLMCTPAELYKDLIAMGYDWEILLNTRPWWCFKESEHKELPFLSTMDLLRLRKGLYSIFWLEDDKKTYKKEFKHKLNT